MEATEEALPAGFWADLVAEFVEDARGLSLEEGVGAVRVTSDEVTNVGNLVGDTDTGSEEHDSTV